MKNIYKYCIGRRRQKKRGSYVDFEATSIGDLAFLLLIFFIVTSSFILRQGIFLSLPSKSAGTIKVNAKDLYHIYPSKEDFTEDGVAISREDLGKKMNMMLKENDKLIVVVHMSKDIPYHRLVDSLSLAKESGVKKISLKDDN